MAVLINRVEMIDMHVHELEACRLVVQDAPWQFALDHEAAIARHWSAAITKNPKIFNGDVFVVERWSIDHHVLVGQSVSTKFAAYLFWRDGTADPGPYSEAFATAVVQSRDGGVLLAQSVEGTLNAGLYGAPGGLLDARDVETDGEFDLAGAAARELSEETGLTGAELERQPGFLLAQVGPFLGVTSVFRSRLTGDELLHRVEAFLDAQADPELVAPRLIYNVAELDPLALTPFGRLLTTHVLGM